jgi:hypothetical protein
MRSWSFPELIASVMVSEAGHYSSVCTTVLALPVQMKKR